MSKRSKLTLLAASLLLVSCAGNYQFSDKVTIPNGVWNNFEPRVFEFDWNKPDMCVDLSLYVVFDTSQFSYSDILCRLTQTAQEGRTTALGTYHPQSKIMILPNDVLR